MDLDHHRRYEIAHDCEENSTVQITQAIETGNEPDTGQHQPSQKIFRRLHRNVGLRQIVFQVLHIGATENHPHELLHWVDRTQFGRSRRGGLFFDGGIGLQPLGQNGPAAAERGRQRVDDQGNGRHQKNTHHDQRLHG